MESSPGGGSDAPTNDSTGPRRSNVQVNEAGSPRLSRSHTAAMNASATSSRIPQARAAPRRMRTTAGPTRIAAPSGFDASLSVNSPAVSISVGASVSRVPLPNPRGSNRTLTSGLPVARTERTSSPRGSPPKASRQPNRHSVSSASGIPNPMKSLSANVDKPLPGAPVAILTNTASPPKAQRTLVDAHDAGTPTAEQWPVIQPNNASPQRRFSSPAPTASTGASFHSAFASPASSTIRGTTRNSQYLQNYSPYQESPALNSNRNSAMESFHSSYNDTSATVHALTTPDDSAAVRSSMASFPDPVDQISAASHRLTTPNDPITLRYSVASSIYSQSEPTMIHALTTPEEAAQESPITSDLAKTPGTSSKRSSLSRPISTSSAVAGTVIRAPLMHVQDQSGNKSQPLAGAQREQSLAGNAFTPYRYDDQTHNENVHASSEQLSFYPGGHSKRLSNDSDNWSQAAGSSLDEEEREIFESSTRVKFLGKQTSSANLGPVIRISADADTIIYGGDADSPPVPAIPPQVALTGRGSRLSLLSVRSRSTTPQSVGSRKSILFRPKSSDTALKSMSRENLDGAPGEVAPIADTTEKAVKVQPIRAMRPERKSSIKYGIDQPSSPAHSSSFGSGFQADQPTSGSVGSRPSVSALESPRESWLPMFKTMSSTNSSPLSTAHKRNSSIMPGRTVYPRRDAYSGPLPSRLRQSLSVAPEANPPLLSRSHASHNFSQTFGSHLEETATDKSCANLDRRSSPFLEHDGDPKASAAILEIAHNPTAFITKNSDVAMNQAANSSVNADGNATPSASQAGTAEQHTAKMKTKRSFRGIFKKRDDKGGDQAAESIGTSFTKRLNFSRTNIGKNPVEDSETMKRPAPKASRISLRFRKSSVPAEVSTTTTSVDPSATTTKTSAAVVDCSGNAATRIMARIETIPKGTPEHVRGCEIAEALLSTVEALKLTQIAATEAKKHARDAAAFAQRAHLDMDKMLKLCERDVERETVTSIKTLIRELKALTPETLGEVKSIMQDHA
ncbi:hypothetical protein CC80DRAFT_121802 [Byssothecium circinans]|uniref:Uncharacterized protein n=1 Tax=Byssothecium circinans TaxID=147558 RepID=A0A6A5TV93_9PLEO|nr:hypothetical protein CC80DRAFT_121802 [Byssothecium circinans]